MKIHLSFFIEAPQDTGLTFSFGNIIFLKSLGIIYYI